MSNKISGIYKIQSIKKSERCYVGSAINIHLRWLSHLSNLKMNKHHSQKLQNHYNKYGKNDLVFSVIIGCDKDDLLTTEQFFIDSLNPYFNINKIAQSIAMINVGRKHTKEHNDKIAKAQMGEKNSFFNKHHTKESNAKRTEWNKLHPITPKIREKQNESRRKSREAKKLKALENVSKN